ncbi:hypothetical protein NE237_029416 [Protea cynaroides]|uniref:RING-type E3 ubiquitin transferase n=1 Tax=Protea cynaroides TaxID=273540 RepID=A0A9Q0GVQ8_9MAGN|nr:hypothetical protein NE237_029416 [Protea cynaroides]
MEEVSSITISVEIMIALIVVLFIVLVFVFFLHLFRARRVDFGTNQRRFVFAPSPRASDNTTNARLRRGLGLEQSVIRSLPILVFHRNEFVEGQECAVCLCELSDGEKVRLLPKCNHRFHVDCIDLWFHSHSTCPLCRSPVKPKSSYPISALPRENIRISTPVTDDSSTTAESLSVPSNILFCVNTGGSYMEDGTSSIYSSSSSSLPPESSRQGREKLVIEIPERLSEGFSSMSPTTEEFRSPMSTRLRSLKRLLSGKSSTVDIEQGEG